jgi:PAS domain S-box-containing protein
MKVDPTTENWIKAQDQALAGLPADARTNPDQVSPETRETLDEVQGRFEAVMHNLREGLIIATSAGQIIYWNAAAGHMYDLPRIGKAYDYLKDLVVIFELSTLDGTILSPGEWPFARILRGEAISGLELRIRRKDRPWERIFSYAGTKVTYGGGQSLAFITVLDITERKRHDQELERLNRLYSALSHINQAIVHVKSREELFQNVCEVLVKHGGFLLAWIGWHDLPARQLLPVAQCGDDNGYVQRIRIYTDDRPEGFGPTGTAFREKRSFICNDTLRDPLTQPWRDEMERRGIHASAVFPIWLKGQPQGAITVYASEAGFFQDREIALVEEVASDVSFALENFEREEERRQAEATAQQEEQFSVTMIDSMPGIIYFYDEQGRFLRWNRNFETVSGYTPAEILHLTPLNFFSPEYHPLLQERIAEVFARGESSVEAPFLTKDGREIPYFFTGKRLSFDGKPCLVGMGVDISERKRAEDLLRKSEERSRTTLDSMMEGCQLIGFDWSYIYLNDAAARHNRRPNAELLGKKMTEMWPGIEQTKVFALLQRTMRERIALHEEVEFVFPDGTKSWFDVRCQPVPEGIFILSIDISERKQAEMALRVLNQTLELEVANRTSDLQAALVRAESADRIKSAFLATMSHELRTPLNSIIGFTGILLQGLAGPLNPEQNKQMGMVRNSARHLLELINDVLDLSKIEAGQLEIRAEPFNLPASIENVAASIRPAAEKKSLKLSVQIAPDVGEMIGDRRRLEQILINLLNNAVKFTEQGSVTLAVDLVDGHSMAHDTAPARLIRLRVTDTGIGIKEEDLNVLFQPFRQINTGLARQHEGTGLGLAICRRLAALMGGEIQVTSKWLHGSTFTAILPCQNKVKP